MNIAPQLILIGMVLIGTGICWARFGQPKQDTYDITDVLIAPVILFALLWWGGFFNPLLGSQP